LIRKISHGLQHPGGDQPFGVGREPAQQRRGGERADPEQEDALAAVDIAQSTAGDERYAEPHAVGRDDELQLA
jgi:hypothetical protein